MQLFSPYTIVSYHHYLFLYRPAGAVEAQTTISADLERLPW
ncbi:MAG: hypothetical protein ACMUIA_00855 [bacterium]